MTFWKNENYREIEYIGAYNEVKVERIYDYRQILKVKFWCDENVCSIFLLQKWLHNCLCFVQIEIL